MPTNTPEYREKNKEKLREYRRKYKEKNPYIRKTNRPYTKPDDGSSRMSLYKELKSTLSCKCGETHPACLDFHHTNPETKSFGVGDRAGKIPHEELLKEIKKCEVLCANCHRKEHYDG